MIIIKMEEFALKRFVKTAYCKKWYILTILMISIILGYLYSYIYNIPEYKSSTTIVLTAISENAENRDTNSITQTDITINQNLVDTYSEIIKSNKVLREVIQNLSLEVNENDLAKMINVEAINNTEILNITVSNEDANLAKDIANEVAKIFSNNVKELYNMDNVNIIDEAEKPEEPYNINHIKDVSIFLIIGILISIGIIFLIYVLDTTIKQEEDIEETVKLPVLGVIPLEPKEDNSKEETKTYKDGKMPIDEAFRTLRTNLTFAQKNKNMKNILITSSYMSEGKSYVSSNLAIALSRTNKKVLLIDSDMRKGRIYSIFGLNNSNGLSNCLSELTNINENNITKYIKVTEVPNVHVITSGDSTKNPLELLSSNKIIELITLLDKIYDIIIIDGTPSILVSDSVALSKFVDTVLLIAAYRNTKIESLQKVKKSLENVGAKITGVILNKYPISESAYGKGYYTESVDSSLKDEDYSKMKIRSVEELIKEANIYNKKEDNTKLKQKDNIEIKLNNTLLENKELSQDNFLLQYKMENISNELSDIKSLFIQYIMNNEPISKEDFEEVRKEIICIKEKIENNNNEVITSEMKKEIENIKVITSNLMNSQEKNNEKVKKFIENYKSNRK